MRFLERTWPVILAIWMIFLITAIIIKLVFLSSISGEVNFTVEELLQGVRQNDTRLVEYIHASQLYSPNYPSQVQEVISENVAVETEANQIAQDVIKVLQEKKNGFFVECRAYDGDILSKTLALEIKFNWTGILLEPDPYLFPKLMSKQRNAWLLNGCLSPDPIARSLDFLRKINQNFTQSGLGSRSYSSDKKSQLWKKLRVICFPLFSITSALQVNTVDFLILDTQGLELQILLNIPWTNIKIHVITVNVHSIPEGSEGLKYYLTSMGYNLLSTVGSFYTFVHKTLTENDE